MKTAFSMRDTTFAFSELTLKPASFLEAFVEIIREMCVRLTFHSSVSTHCEASSASSK